MKWTKLEYGKWPEGEILLRVEDDKGRIWHQVGIISQQLENKQWYLHMNYTFISKVSIDSLCENILHYIHPQNLEMPE